MSDWKKVLNTDREIQNRKKEFVDKVGDNREKADKVKEYLGVTRLPGSIIGVNHSKRSIDFSHDARSRHRRVHDHLTKFTPIKKIKTLSRFPYNIGELFVKVYTKEKEYIIDPFAGHNSRMEICYKLNRHYVGWDLNDEFMYFNKEILKTLRQQTTLTNEKPIIKLITGDSKKINYNNKFDFCITSPPYYDVEDYGEEEGQLPKCKTYDDFLNDLYVIVKNCYNSLKKGKYICWLVGDIRRKGEFLMFHADTASLFKLAGFKLWDIIIINNHEAVTRNFPNQFMKNKQFPKTHEYAIVGKKI